MNEQQVLSFIRWVQATFGPIMISHGYISASNLEMGVGVVISVVPLVWGLFVHTQTNAVAVVASLAALPDSPVKAVVLDPTKAGIELAQVTPGTVIAGTMAAEKVVK